MPLARKFGESSPRLGSIILKSSFRAAFFMPVRKVHGPHTDHNCVSLVVADAITHMFNIYNCKVNY